MTDSKQPSDTVQVDVYDDNTGEIVETKAVPRSFYQRLVQSDAAKVQEDLDRVELNGLQALTDMDIDDTVNHHIAQWAEAVFELDSAARANEKLPYRVTGGEVKAKLTVTFDLSYTVKGGMTEVSPTVAYKPPTPAPLAGRQIYLRGHVNQIDKTEQGDMFAKPRGD